MDAKTATTMSIMTGIIARVLYISHTAFAIWQVYYETGNVVYWTLATSILLLILEGIISLYFRQGRDWNWFSPSVFFYLCGLIPAVWILELDAVTDYSVNFTVNCLSNTQPSLATPTATSALQKLYAALQQKGNWLLAIEQSTLFVLIIGRWLTPRDRLTRNQQSQLLLIYIGNGADIIELFETFEEPSIRTDRILVIIIMAVWTWSLLQYVIVFMSIKSIKGKNNRRITIINPVLRRSNSISENDNNRHCCNAEIAAPLITIIMQDSPFLALRLYLFYVGILSPMLLFFAGKNVLVLILQIYRLVAICCDKDDNHRDINISASTANKRAARNSALAC